MNNDHVSSIGRIQLPVDTGIRRNIVSAQPGNQLGSDNRLVTADWKRYTCRIRAPATNGFDLRSVVPELAFRSVLCPPGEWGSHSNHDGLLCTGLYTIVNTNKVNKIISADSTGAAVLLMTIMINVRSSRVNLSVAFPSGDKAETASMRQPGQGTRLQRPTADSFIIELLGAAFCTAKAT